MEDEKPAGGKWNYDHDNRKKLPAKHVVPEPYVLQHDLSDIVNAVTKSGITTIGEIEPSNFIWPLDREEAMGVYQNFLDNLLPLFGTYQDALTTSSWSVYHSRISFAMNLKMISPSEIVQMAEASWRDDPERVTIAQVEGFIRQILGWREYMRGIYWHFKNKDEIILAIVESIFTQQMDFLDSAMSAEVTAIKRLDHLIGLIEASLENLTEEIPSPLDIYALAMRQPEIMGHMKNYFLRYQEHLVDLIEQGISEGVLQVANPQQAAFVLMSTVEGILLLAIVTETAETIPDSLRQAKEIFLHGIKGN